MQKIKSIFLTALLLVSGSVFSVVSAVCACEPVPVPTPVNNGGFAFASFGNGAQFTWSTYVAPVINLTQNGSTTVANTTPGYFTNLPAIPGSLNSKFVFNRDMYVWSNMNNLNPDFQELLKVLVAENLLPANSNKIVYDAEVKNAVEKFQKAHNIRPAPGYTYGYFGPLTRAFINNK